MDKRGNQLHDTYRFTDYYVFREKFDSYLSENSITKNKLLKGTIREGVKAIPYAGDLISWFFEILSDRYMKNDSSLLSLQCNEVMTVFQSIFQKQESLIIFDDINRFDQASMDLLKYLISGTLNNKFTFLKDASILLIINTENDYDFLKWLNNTSLKYKEYTVPAASLDDIKDILIKFNYNSIDSISPKTIEFIYNISGGNIELIKQMILFLNDADKSFETLFETNNINQKHVFYDIIKLIFNNRAKYNKLGYCKKIAQCLQFMKTGEYFLRANFLFENGEVEDSLLLYLIGFFQQLRNDLYVSKSINYRIWFLLRDNPLKDYYINMKEAYNSYKQQDFNNCINKLLKIGDAIPPILNIEKEYLLAIASKKIYSTNTDLNYSKERLEFIYNNNMAETELWARCASCLMALYYDCFHDDKKAFEINRRLFNYYSERISFDPLAEYNINVLYRKSKMFYTSDIAIKSTEKSVEFFKRTSYLSQYYKSLCNHLGNLITLGQYHEAFNYIKENFSIISNYESLNTNNNYYLANNVILSGVYSNSLDISEGVKIFEKILESNLQSDDSFIIENNLSVLLAL